jgi:MtN3 and saliva related transmembrane protein
MAVLCASISRVLTHLSGTGKKLSASDLIGYVAATLTTCSFLPQALHTFRTRDVSGISLGMYSVFTSGVALWLAYGVVLQAWPIVIANAITLVLASAILGMKLRFGHRPAG